jgi:hypothetical protein
LAGQANRVKCSQKQNFLKLFCDSLRADDGNVRPLFKRILAVSCTATLVGGNVTEVKTKLTSKEWMDDLLEYERTHEIAFASPRALLEARMIAEMDKVRGRRRHRSRRNVLARRRKTAAA